MSWASVREEMQTEINTCRISPSVRLRRALELRSLSLVKRIILSNPDAPSLIRNHDPDDKGNTSLHIAARMGLVDIAVRLLEQEAQL